MRSPLTFRLLCSSATLFLASACGQIGLSSYGDSLVEWRNDNEDGDTGTFFDDQDDEEMDEEQDTEEPPTLECSQENFHSVATQTTLNESNPSSPKFSHRAINYEGYPNDELQLVSFQGAPYNGPSSPGRYDLAGQDTSDCGLCLILLSGCQRDSCDTTYFAKSGTVEFIQIQGVGGTFVAEFSDVVLEEVIVDPSTYRSTPVTNGKTWCLDNLRIEDYILPGF